jgi:RluA family pseudouridine synthase
MSIQKIFEDRDIIAVDKPCGLASTPEKKDDPDCLVSLLTKSCGHKIYIVHRLDKEASGIILFAKNAAAHRYLNSQFGSRKVEKTYVAVVHGEMDNQSGAIRKPLREFGSGRMGIDETKGKESLTHFTVLQRITGYTLLRLQPTTGRRHQLRVHLYSIGHPIVGDIRYGDTQLQKNFPRLMLHAQRIIARLPCGKILDATAPIPDSFCESLRALSPQMTVRLPEPTKKSCVRK